jgi:Domain of unknown function (DUF3416).
MDDSLRASEREDAALARLERLAANRVAIEAVSPEIDAGRFAAKAVIGERFTVEADIFADGHDKIDAALLTRPKGSKAWIETPMRPLVNDRWRGATVFGTLGDWEYTLIAWRDEWASWLDEAAKKRNAGVAIDLELIEARALLVRARDEGAQVSTEDRAAFDALLVELDAAETADERYGLAASDATAALVRRAAFRTNLSAYERVVPVWVDRERARLAYS